MTGDIKEQRKDECGNQSQKQVGENAPFLRGPLLVTGSALGAGAHRDSVLVLQIPGQFAGIVIAVQGIALHCPEDDFLQRGRDFRSNLPEWRRIGAEFNIQDQEGVRSEEWSLARQQFVKNNPREYRSLRASPRFPLTCSGEMYSGVP